MRSSSASRLSCSGVFLTAGCFAFFLSLFLFATRQSTISVTRLNRNSTIAISEPIVVERSTNRSGIGNTYVKSLKNSVGAGSVAMRTGPDSIHSTAAANMTVDAAKTRVETMRKMTSNALHLRLPLTATAIVETSKNSARTPAPATKAILKILLQSIIFQLYNHRIDLSMLNE